MKFVSLFAGIGGLDLGLERAGMTCVAQVENNPWCTRVLANHWPDVPRWADIHDLDPKELPAHDLITGGFPCQPVSYAGARLAQADPRWLWPEFFRIVRALRPRFVLVENVPGLASAGMGDVLRDLASVGYDAEWQSIPAAFVGAPHLRWRVFIVAYPGSIKHKGAGSTIRWPRAAKLSPHSDEYGEPGGAVNAEPRPGELVLADTDSLRSGRVGRMDRYPDRQGRESATTGAEGVRPGTGGSQDDHFGPGGAALADTRSGGCGEGADEPGDDEAGRTTPSGQDSDSPVRSAVPGVITRGGGVRGTEDVVDTDRKVRTTKRSAGEKVFRSGPFQRSGRRGSGDRSDWWAVEPDVGRVAYGIPRRVDRLRGLGNAVVPQVAELVGRLIMEAAP